MPEPLLSRRYIDGIYIPVGLIIVGTFIVKREWVPYAVVVAFALGGYKFLDSRECRLIQVLRLFAIRSSNPEFLQQNRRRLSNLMSSRNMS
jgi:hypothetical protein